MSWVILIVSGVLEAVWATALGKSEGFTKLWPTVVFGVTLVASMGGLAWAMRDISTGTAYAVWVGIGAVADRRLRDDHGRRALLDREDAAHPGAGRLCRRSQAGGSRIAIPKRGLSHLQLHVEVTSG